jgi:thiamine biosynthesis lipoprotein
MMSAPTNVASLEWRWNGYSFKAMNTKIQTWLYSQTDGGVLVDVQRLFNSFEKRLSRFDPDSDLSKLNACEDSMFRASPILLDAVETALWAAEISSGLYDPTILTELRQAGYDRSFETIPQAAPLTKVSLTQSHSLQPTHRPGGADPARPYTFRSIWLDRPGREIHKPPAVQLDLGGMGKGWTVDRAADRLQGLGPFLINAGGDIYAYQSPPGWTGWDIDLIHPLKPAHFMARVQLHQRALATSTIARRRWQHNGQTMHHLIDPRTGRPAQTDALSVSVITDRTVVAEVFAKVALILGAPAGLAYLERLPDVEGLIYTADSEIIYTSGFGPILDRVDSQGYESS